MLMEADVEGLIGARRQEQTGERLNYRNGFLHLRNVRGHSLPLGPSLYRVRAGTSTRRTSG
jgi:hypothetical protein